MNYLLVSFSLWSGCDYILLYFTAVVNSFFEDYISAISSYNRGYLSGNFFFNVTSFISNVILYM